MSVTVKKLRERNVASAIAPSLPAAGDLERLVPARFDSGVRSTSKQPAPT